MTETEQLYVEETSERSLSRGYLRLSLIASWVLALVAVAGCVLASVSAGKRHAYIVRIEPSGHYEVVAEGFQFKRQPEEIKFFLHWFAKAYFSRDRATIQSLPQTLLYFSPTLRSDIAAAWKEGKTIETAVSSPVQVDATATEIHLNREGTEAYLTVRLDRTSGGQRQEPQMLSSYVRFTCLACDGKPVPDEVAAVNPLGFMISNLPALEEQKQ